MKPASPAEQTASRFLREFLAVLRRHRRESFRFGETIDGVRLCVSARRIAEADLSIDIPDAIRVSPPSVRRTFRVLESFRNEFGEDCRCWPIDLQRFIRTSDPEGDEPSIDTLNHALRELHNRGVARSTQARGWLIGPEQPSLPISVRQTETPSVGGIIAYRSDVASNPVRRFTGAIMPKTRIWVPVEKTDFGPMVVVDELTEEEIPVQDAPLGKLHMPTRSGTREVSAVRADLVRADEKRAVVRVSGRNVTVRVLGEWHLKGHTKPEPTAVA